MALSRGVTPYLPSLNLGKPKKISAFQAEGLRKDQHKSHSPELLAHYLSMHQITDVIEALSTVRRCRLISNQLDPAFKSACVSTGSKQSAFKAIGFKCRFQISTCAPLHHGARHDAPGEAVHIPRRRPQARGKAVQVDIRLTLG